MPTSVRVTVGCVEGTMVIHCTVMVHVEKNISIYMDLVALLC